MSQDTFVSSKPRIPFGVYVLLVAKVVMTAGNFVYPFLSLYLTKKAGMTEDSAGVIIMATAFASILGSVVGGTLADYFGCKHVMVAALVMASLCCLAVPFAQDKHVMVTLIALSLACLSASDPAFNSLIADLTAQGARRAAYSLTYWGQNIGFAVGPLIAGVLFNSNINLIFWLDGAATLCAGMLILVWVPWPHRRRRGKGAARREELATRSGLRFIRSAWVHRAILLFCVFFTAHSFIYAQTNFVLPLYLHKIFGRSGVELYGMLMAVNGVAVMVLTPVIVRLTKGISPARCVAMGIGLYSFAFGIYIFYEDIIWFVVSAVIWSVGEILAVTNSKVFVAERAPPDQRGRYNVFLDVSYEAGFGLGPGVMGKVIISMGMMYTWIIIVAVSLISSLAIFLMGHSGSHGESRVAWSGQKLSAREGNSG